MFAGERAAFAGGATIRRRPAGGGDADRGAITPRSPMVSSTQMTALGGSGWLIQNRGALRTVPSRDAARFHRFRAASA
jgi:hypothetical protein